MDDWVERVTQGDRRALARVISVLESGSREADDVGQRLQELAQRAEQPHIIGVTGPPGAGKSSLCDRLIESWRQLEQRVAVLAVDPSSPFSGGAVLGDRVRMNQHALDDGVFIRSMGTRGSSGGLARPVRAAVKAMCAAPFDVLLIETVGVGQAELSVMHVADTVMVVLTPAGGDQVQATKAGIMEIADVFVVNKADYPGADRTVHDIRDMLHVSAAARREKSGWEPRVVKASATSGLGVKDVLDALAAHHAYLIASGTLAGRRQERVRQEMVDAYLEQMAVWARERLDADPEVRQLVAAACAGRLSAFAAAQQAVRRVTRASVGEDGTTAPTGEVDDRRPPRGSQR